MSNSRVSAHLHFQPIELAFVQRQSSVVMWPVRLDTECHYLPTIYLLAFCILHAFEPFGWWELGQVMGAHSVAWIRSYDCRSSDLAAQRLLQFNP